MAIHSVGLDEGRSSLRKFAAIAHAGQSSMFAAVVVSPRRHRQDALAKRYEKALGRFELIPVSTEIAAND